jgi:hypothetical protein
LILTTIPDIGRFCSIVVSLFHRKNVGFRKIVHLFKVPYI